MKKLQRHKWLLAAGVLTMVVGLGVAACDSSASEQTAVRGQGAGAQMQSTDGDAAGGMMAQRQAAQNRQTAQNRQARQDRREGMAERRQALMDAVREKMSSEDQALYDQLTATLEQQRTAAQEARQELADTLKELRALVDKYLELSASGSN
jgi:hypothetical protein